MQIHLKRDHIGVTPSAVRESDTVPAPSSIGRQQQIDLIQAEKSRRRAGILHRQRNTVPRGILCLRGHRFGVAYAGAVDGDPRAQCRLRCPAVCTRKGAGL